MKTIIPAILTDDVADLESKLQAIRGLTHWVQIDVADGKFVDNTSITVKDILTVEGTEHFSLEIHLMVRNPEAYFFDCEKVNAKRVIFHCEAVDNLSRILSGAKKFSFKTGIALNPDTPITTIAPHADNLDFILLMSVVPGFQGQKFIDNTLERIRALKKIAPRITIEVDGGITLSNIAIVSDAGADYMVVGSDLFKSKNIEDQFKKLTEKING